MIDRRLLIAGLASGLVSTTVALPAQAQMTGGGAAPSPSPSLIPPLSSIPGLAPKRPGAPRWVRNAVVPPRRDGRPIITIVIDDLGVVHPGTERIMALAAPLTLAWFPFARNLPAQVAEGRARGHEAILHMPMQATGKTTAWTGPDPLTTDVSPAENLRRLQAALDAVPDTVGLNNHMGSVATLSAPLMDIVAAEAKLRGMLVLDSVTIPHSRVASQAALIGVPSASRDLFIDWQADPAVIKTQLALIEASALRHGSVIAIGHPWPNTLDALEAWVPTLARKGFALWPLSATVALRNEITISV